jgi:hypothetical protein
MPHRRRRLPTAIAYAVIAVLLAFRLDQACAENVTQPDFPLDMFARCFSQSGEIVFSPEPHCLPHYAGQNVDQTEFRDENPDKICGMEQSPRRLPVDAIKRLSAYGSKPVTVRNEANIWPMGIRILGAVFCPQAAGDGAQAPSNPVALDLAGLDLPYSLVIDDSVFMGAIDARNLRIKGDFSLDHAIVTDGLLLNRARVDGSFYSERSFIDRLQVNDTVVSGSWWQDDGGLVFSFARFNQAHIAGGLSLKDTAMGQILIQSSSIAGTLLLDGSEVRCSYDLNASNFGFLSATKVGFGVIETSEVTANHALQYSWWRPVDSNSKRSKIFGSGMVRALIEKKKTKVVETERKAKNPSHFPGCSDLSSDLSSSPLKRLEFSVAERTIPAAFCLTSFTWARNDAPPTEEGPEQIIALDDTKVGGILVIDLLGSSAGKEAEGRQSANRGIGDSKLLTSPQARSLTISLAPHTPPISTD